MWYVRVSGLEGREQERERERGAGEKEIRRGQADSKKEAESRTWYSKGRLAEREE